MRAPEALDPIDPRVINIIWSDGSCRPWCDRRERLRPGLNATLRRVQWITEEICACPLCRAANKLFVVRSAVKKKLTRRA